MAKNKSTATLSDEVWQHWSLQVCWAKTIAELVAYSVCVAETVLGFRQSDLQSKPDEDLVTREQRLSEAAIDKKRPEDERLCARVLLSAQQNKTWGQDEVLAPFNIDGPERLYCEIFHLGSMVGLLLRGGTHLFNLLSQDLRNRTKGIQHQQETARTRKERARQEFRRRRATDSEKPKTVILK